MIDTNTINAIPGSKVLTPEGDKIGTAQQVYVSEQDGKTPMFATVNTGLFGNNETFIPLTTATFDGQVLHVAYTKDVVKQAPQIKADHDISDAEQDEIFSYYAEHLDGGTADETDNDTPGQNTQTTEPTENQSVNSFPSSVTPQNDDDNSLVLAKEQLKVGTKQVEVGKARLRKYIVTEQQTITVPVSHEEVRIERTPIGDDQPANIELSDDEQTITLHAEQPVITKETVATERVSLGTETVTEQQQVTESVRSEQIDTDGVNGVDSTS